MFAPCGSLVHFQSTWCGIFSFRVEEEGRSDSTLLARARICARSKTSKYRFPPPSPIILITYDHISSTQHTYKILTWNCERIWMGWCWFLLAALGCCARLFLNEKFLLVFLCLWRECEIGGSWRKRSANEESISATAMMRCLVFARAISANESSVMDVSCVCLKCKRVDCRDCVKCVMKCVLCLLKFANESSVCSV